MFADLDVRAEAVLRVARDNHAFRRVGSRPGRDGQVARGPCGEHVTDVHRIFAARQQVIGLVEADEALWVLGRGKQLPGILYIDNVIERCVQD